MSWARRTRAVALIGGCAWWGLAVRVAGAEPSPLLGRTNPLGELFPTPSARAAAERTRLERELEGTLRTLPGVAYADVVLSLPSADAVPVDQPLPPPRASVLVGVWRGAAEPSEERVRTLVAGALPPDSHVHIDVSPQPATPPREPAPRTNDSPQARVGPFWVARQSARWLRATLAACLITNAGLAAWILRQRWRS